MPNDLSSPRPPAHVSGYRPLYCLRPSGRIKPVDPTRSVLQSELNVFQSRCRFAFVRLKAEKRLDAVSESWTAALAGLQADSDAHDSAHREAVALFSRLRESTSPFELVTTLSALALYATETPERFASPVVLHRSVIRSLFALTLGDHGYGGEMPPSAVAAQASPEAQALVVDWLTDVAGPLADDVANEALNS